MFQLCFSKHNSSALWAVGALASSSVNVWDQCHLCKMGKRSLSWNSSNLHKMSIRFEQSPKGVAQLVWKGKQPRFAPCGNCRVHRGESIPPGKGTVRVLDSGCQGVWVKLLSMWHCFPTPSSSCLTLLEPGPESQLQSNAPSISQHCTWLCYLLCAVWVWGRMVCCR